MKELSCKQIARQDFVDNSIYNLINEINPTDIPISWNIDFIGTIRDCIQQYYIDNNICSQQEFYPYIIE